MVGSAAIKQGRSASRKHTYFFFLALVIILGSLTGFQMQQQCHSSILNFLHSLMILSKLVSKSVVSTALLF